MGLQGSKAEVRMPHTIKMQARDTCLQESMMLCSLLAAITAGL